MCVAGRNLRKLRHEGSALRCVQRYHGAQRVGHVREGALRSRQAQAHVDAVRKLAMPTSASVLIANQLVCLTYRRFILAQSILILQLL